MRIKRSKSNRNLILDLAKCAVDKSLHPRCNADGGGFMNGVIYACYSSDNQREESIEGQLHQNKKTHYGSFCFGKTHAETVKIGKRAFNIRLLFCLEQNIEHRLRQLLHKRHSAHIV